MRTPFLTLVLLFITIYCLAQSKDEKKYRKESEEMRKQVWAWNDSKFKIKDIPRQYAGASKVIIAHHTELTAASRSRLGFYGLSFGAKKEQSLTEIVREIIKLNDKNAVTEYSELSFTLFEKSSGLLTDNKANTYIGVRVTKPNGTVKEIDADDIVLTKDESSEKKAKIAIPDLQPGDILDYFIAVDNDMNNYSVSKSYQITLFDDAPVLSYSFHAELGKKYAIEYRSFNSAPELKISKNSDKEIIVDLEKTNIPPFETSLWVAGERQLPFIQLKILLSYASAYQRKYFDLRKPGEIYNIKDNSEALDDMATGYSNIYFSEYLPKSYQSFFAQAVDDVTRRAKMMGIDYNSLGNEEKAAFLFYSFRFSYPLGPNVNDVPGTVNRGNVSIYSKYPSLFFTFKKAGFEPALIISEDRTGYKMNEIINAKEFVVTPYVKGVNKFFSIRSIFDLPFEASENIDGVKNTKSFRFKNSGKNPDELTIVESGPDIKARPATENARIEKLKISLSTDRSVLAVKRSTILRGYYKAGIQGELILFEDYYESERKIFKEESLFENLEKDKNKKKYVQDFKNAFAEARKKQKDAFVKDAKDWFDQEIIDLKDFKIDSMGVRHTSPDFVYSSSFNLGGLVKKAGNNFIIEIGRVQGQPLAVKNEQRQREIDVYMPFARSIEYNIELEIPDGYMVEGAQALNTKVENETGFFIAEASNTDKLVTIKVRKHYLHNYEPAANFDKMLAFIDASNNWVNAKLLFKKK